MAMTSLFTPLQLRGVTLKNRIVVSPMSQYRAKEGVADDWHLVHLGRFALGGAGLVFAEATAVEARGRRTHGDLGLWSDAQVEPLARVVRFLEAEGAVAGIQLGHAGRKASERRPWHGETPVDATDAEERGEAPWPAIAPSPLAYADGWPEPQAMTDDDVAQVIDAFEAAAGRAAAAGFRVLEIYAAHGFLIHQFLSPLANLRTDRWGGDGAGRRRFAVEVARAVRRAWPERLPLSFRLSATDWVEGGLEVDDTVAVARALAAEGVDLIDVSSGGIGGRERPQRMALAQGFQVPFAETVRREAAIATIAVGLLWDVEACDAIVRDGRADLVALAREVLDDSNWPLHAARHLGADTEHAHWPVEAGWWLMKRQRLLDRLGLR